MRHCCHAVVCMTKLYGIFWKTFIALISTCPWQIHNSSQLLPNSFRVMHMHIVLACCMCIIIRFSFHVSVAWEVGWWSQTHVLCTEQHKYHKHHCHRVTWRKQVQITVHTFCCSFYCHLVILFLASLQDNILMPYS